MWPPRLSSERKKTCPQVIAASVPACNPTTTRFMKSKTMIKQEATKQLASSQTCQNDGSTKWAFSSGISNKLPRISAAVSPPAYECILYDALHLSFHQHLQLTSSAKSRGNCFVLKKGITELKGPEVSCSHIGSKFDRPTDRHLMNKKTRCDMPYASYRSKSFQRARESSSII